jgi:hypothetical protein
MYLEIHESARKHGIADKDIEHAVNHAMSIDDQTMALGFILGQLVTPIFSR